ncbi:hypothetical protein ESCO_003400 [Escovopsis weberi]|uniref:EDC4-like protein pdc1 beta-propeller domain-containing protein n=1 Tax=Escovopsis weberi TaxID=150374 RepID=A0A0M8NAD1_ESCWE|nr:hypothetical protein ESCO_003400 [Escovopsis weberi]
MEMPPAPTPPMNGGGIGQNPDRTANLLSLLKFSAPGSASSSSQKPLAQPHQPQPSQQQSQRDLQHLQQEQEPVPAGDEEEEDDDDVEEEGEDEALHPQQPNQMNRQPSSTSMQAQNQLPTRIHQPAPTAADPSGLLAALIRGTHDMEETKSHAAPPPPPPAQPTNPFANNGSPSADTRTYLLNLLNRPKPSQTDQPVLAESSSSRANESAAHSTEPPAEAIHFLETHHQPPHPYNPHQAYPLESFSDMQRPINANPYQYPQTQLVQEPADMSVIYQQLMGSLNQASPQNTTNNNLDGSVHGSVHGSNAPSIHILKKDQGSPVGSFDHSRPVKDHSPFAGPSGQRLSLGRTSSLRSHHSSQSAQYSVKPTPPTLESAAFGNLDQNNQAVPNPLAPLVSLLTSGARDSHDGSDRETRGSAAGAVESVSKNEEIDWTQTAAATSDAVSSLEKQILEGIKADQDKRKSYGSLEEHSPRKAEETAGETAGDAHGVADNWENAEQDEAVVADEKETPAVKVFNFPMKPWISISLNDDATEPRPQFKDESIMDIARLKKDFDQIDRNLYTASQTYMTYGMSKQGGLRVIRQDDGKDAKVFTDTKDRVFNVAMSVTPPDHDGVAREAIIGTGISGTVYWVQIKDGEKDHIEDHLEQYGFALPPISSPDGDAPGGALKTRARASTTHPEFFAVGRGKSINFIWPSYIMQNKLFKPGHDRVVDTEALLDQCSLKINTGKAGKDFTFSQDDTVVVSLDKSGRVKFWDVRDLTAAKEGTESLPLPAHSSLEVKEPIMTLASTPEGEKAWPTSVLLLDKQRPYQKRCALRYMIVGMKQNHTLQLWDLALGKPVQEFNLPHSKESDAVCSVMYHPASGMVIIGHPTRNSVYFAHLSAPKYNLKSVSQAEYIQRLVAQDPSIPQPDSTAVISGVREYSFANRGILRSLDILSNPAMIHDADEPTLFELYAMHSKGVACLLIRQAELGWSKDNKVLEPVDAVSEGVVTVAKLKSPPQTEIVQPTAAPEPAPVRIAHRTAAKEIVAQSGSSNSEATPRGAESITPIKFKNEPKETETPVQSSKENHAEKHERKQRKKKGKEVEISANGNFQKLDAPKTSNGFSANGISSEPSDSAIHGLEVRLRAAMSESLKTSFNGLHSKIDESARAREERFGEHQLKLLDMVSEVLNENTQNVLNELVVKQFKEKLLPSVEDNVAKAVSDLFEHKLQPSTLSMFQIEMQTALPQAVDRSLQSSDFHKAISENIASEVSASIEREFATLTHRLAPTITTIANQTAQRVANEIHQRYHDQFEQLKEQHVADNHKTDQLLSYVSRLTDMVSTMAASQSALQAEFLKLKSHPLELPAVHNLHASGIAHGLGPHHGYGNSITSPRSSYAPSQAPSQVASHPHQYVNSPQYLRGSQQVSQISSPHGSIAASEHVAPVTSVNALAGAYAHQMSKTEAEADHDLIQRIRVIEALIQENRLQDAMIRWIQSGREEEIFRRCLSRYPASKFENLPPLMLLVVIATISKDLKPNSRLKEEVEWIEMAVRAFGFNLPHFGLDSEVSREVAKSTLQTMQLLINRIKPLIINMQDGFPTDPFLANVDRGKLEWIVVTSQHILDTFTRGSR